jgi:hypothetical protein
MIIKQLSVFLENESGRLTELTKVLSENNINIAALSIAETEDFGIMRMIVSDPEKAIEVLKENGFSVHTTDVLCIVTLDVPGALHETLSYLSDAGINVSYMYGYSSDNKAPLIIKVSNPESAVKILTEKNVSMIPAEEFYKNS